MTNNLVVVLTGTITPSKGAKPLRNNPELRRNDYLRALEFWLNVDDPRLNKIVFLENSMADLADFADLVQSINPYRKQVEFVSTQSREIPAGIQYGWGELQMLDEGLMKSRLVAESTHFLKVTGRLTFPNIKRLLDRMPWDFDALVECRIPLSEIRYGMALIPAILERRAAYASTQLAFFRTEIYKNHFIGLYQRMKAYTRSGIMEYVVYERLKEFENELKIYWRFPVNCDPVGIGANYERNYQSIQKRAIQIIRAMLRPFNSIWI